METEELEDVAVDRTEQPARNDDRVRRKRPRYVPYTVGMAGFLSLFAIWGNFYVFGIVFLPFLCQFKAGRAVTSGVNSVSLLMLALVSPFITIIVKRWGSGVTLLAGALLCFMANVLASFSESIGMLYLTYGILLGTGSSFSYTSVLVDLPSYYPPGQRSRAIAVVETGAVLGLICMAPLMDFCVKELGWRRALWVFGGLMGALLLPGPFAFNPHHKYVADDEDDNDDVNISPVSEEDAAGGTLADSSPAAAAAAAAATCSAGSHLSSGALNSSRSTASSMLVLRDRHSSPVTDDTHHSASSNRNVEAATPTDGPSPGVAADDTAGTMSSTNVHVVQDSRNSNGEVGTSALVLAAGGEEVVSDTAPLLESASAPDRTTSFPQAELTGWRPFRIVWRDNRFKLFTLGACLWYFTFSAPLVYLVDMRESLMKSGNSTDDTEVCVSSFTDGVLYIYMALGMLVCFPVAGHIFDKLQAAYQRLLVLIGLYVVTGFLVGVIPLARTEWQFGLVSFGVGISRTPDVLHPAFLLSICGEDLYPYAFPLLLCLSALVDGAAPPIVGAIHDSVGEFVTPYLIMVGVIGMATIVLLVLLVQMSDRPRAWCRSLVKGCCCNRAGRGNFSLQPRENRDVDGVETDL